VKTAHSNKTRPRIAIEFKEESLHLLDIEDARRGLDLPLAREENGSISTASFDAALNSIRSFCQGDGVYGAPVICSIPTRGVSVRMLNLPSNARENIGRLLMLQLEARLPVSPDDLAWGYTKIPENRASADAAQMQSFLVAAVKKEFLSDYTRLAAAAGLSPRFAIAALARCSLGTGPARGFASLDIGRTKSELAIIDQNGSAALRVLSWGNDRLPETGPLQKAVSQPGVQRVYISGTGAQNVAAELQGIQPALISEAIQEGNGPGQTIANLAMRSAIERGAPVLTLGESAAAAEPERAQTSWKWAIAVAVLLLISLSLRYAEGTFYRAKISRNLAKVSKYHETLPNVDRELSFLNFIKTNQPPYLEAIAVVSSAAPPGTRVDSLNLVRHGDLSLRGSSSDLQAPSHFRSKLIDSGYFSHVVIEEQTPVENNQKVNFRMSAQVKPDGLRKPFIIEAAAKKAAPESKAARGTNAMGTNAVAAPPAQKSTSQPVPGKNPAGTELTTK
jgi:hypothetical protein